MADYPVNTRPHRLMVRVKAGVNSPLSSEDERAGPRKETCQYDARFTRPPNENRVISSISEVASFPSGASLHHSLQKHAYKPFAIDHRRIGGIRLHSWEVDDNKSITAPFRVFDGEA